MSDSNPSLHIDTDWKKQAQEEKRRLAEQEKLKAAAAESAVPTGSPSSDRTAGRAGGADTGTTAGSSATGGGPARRPGAASGRATGGRASREMPPASLGTLVQSLVTQALFYLGDLSPRGGEPVLDLDMAKHQIDLLGVLEEKTANNLTPDEKRMLDAALYESRMRYISVASQFIS